MARVFLIGFVIAIMLIPLSLGATLYGNIYDLSLEKIKGAAIEINTTPNQLLIAPSGSYSLNVPKGSYKLKAYLLEGREVQLEENRTVQVEDNGSYALDFILFPILETEEEPMIEVKELEKNGFSLVGILIIGLVIIIAVVGFVMYSQIKKNAGDSQKSDQKKENVHVEKDDLVRLVEIVEKEGGRASQKQIRKEFPHSEAKISLMITELEEKGKIEKIKKGRGNIIILKKE